MNTETKSPLEALRAPVPGHLVGLLPRAKYKDAKRGYCAECGGYHGLPAVHLQYMGHAAVTHCLLDADPQWSWEPVAFNEMGLPRVDEHGGLWIRLTVDGMTRLGYGHADGVIGPDAIKIAIGDAIRNAAMRFGLGLEFWHKGELWETENREDAVPPKEKLVVGPEELLEKIATADTQELGNIRMVIWDEFKNSESFDGLVEAYKARKEELK